MNTITKHLSVLLADDDPHDQARMQMALNGADSKANIDLVCNGMQLLDHLVKKYTGKNRLLPDLIITDLYMPFAGGLHVLKQIRKRKEFSHIPIYVFSANNDKTIRSKVLENGATEFHQKPEDFNLLLDIVNTILSKSVSRVVEA